MEEKRCQIITGKNYLKTLKACSLDQEDKISIPEAEILKTIKQDLNRSSLISDDKQFSEVTRRWLEEYRYTVDNDYFQERIEGQFIPYAKARIARNLYFQYKINHSEFVASEDIFEKLSFTYFDDTDLLCSFTLTVLKECPAVWFICITANTTASADERIQTVLVPECLAIDLEQSPMFAKLPSGLAIEKEANQVSPLSFNETFTVKINNKKELIRFFIENTKIKGAHFFNMRSLDKCLGYALNNNYIKFALISLFNKQGKIDIQQFTQLNQAIEAKAANFNLPKEQIEQFLNKTKLTKLLADLVQKKENQPHNLSLLDKIITAANYTLNNYSIRQYNKVLQSYAATFYPQAQECLGHNFDFIFNLDTFKSLTSRKIIDILTTNSLYDFQNFRLQLLLGIYPNSPLKAEIKKYQLLIQEEYLNSNSIIGLEPADLAKDLNSLGDLLINPDAKTFTKYLKRVQVNEYASSRQLIGGAVMTSTVVCSLMAAAGVAVVTAPITMGASLITLGLFAGGTITSSIIGSGIGIGLMQAGKIKEEYKSNLESLSAKLIALAPREWVLCMVDNIFDIHNEGYKEVLSKKIEKAKDLGEVCKHLAEMTFSLYAIAADKAEAIKEVRAKVALLAIDQPLSELSSIQEKSSAELIEKNTLWAEEEYIKLKNNIANYDKDKIEKNTSKLQKKFSKTQEAYGVLLFNQQVKRTLNDRTQYKRNNKSSRNIIINLLINIQKNSNKDQLITYLDEALFALINITEDKDSTKKLCLSLAKAVLDNIDIHAANPIKKIKSKSLECFKIAQEQERPSLLIEKNIAWAKAEYKKLENIKEKDSVIKGIKFRKQLSKAYKIVLFSQDISTALNNLAQRNTKDNQRDDILTNLMINIKGVTNKSQLIMHLDNTIFALLDNNKNSKIAVELLDLRKAHFPFANTEGQSLFYSSNPSYGF